MTNGHTLLAPIQPPAEGGSKIVFGDGPGDPFPGAIEGAMGQVQFSQVHFHLGEIREVGWREVR